MKPINKESAWKMLEQMVLCRRFEEATIKAYQQKFITGFLHTYIGQEACAVGAMAHMTDEDSFVTSYRCHAQGLIAGMTPRSIMAELYGKITGCVRGKGGSMHVFSKQHKHLGGHGIVGGQIPLGTGLAYALKYQGLKGAAMAFMGDGAVNQGAVHEAYNLASLWNLPVVFVIENNGYSMGTSQARSSAGELAKRAEGYNMAWGQCNGHDLYEVRACMDKFLTLAREQSRPSTVEIDTYRYRGHSVADPDNTYRSKSEIEEYRKTKDPIQVFQNQLIAEGVLDEATIEKIDAEARAEAENAAEFAEASPYPTTEDIQKDVYWETDNPAARASKGRLFFN